MRRDESFRKNRPVGERVQVDYDKQVKAIVDYLRRGERVPSQFKLGVELEHLVLDGITLEAVPFEGARGVEALLRELTTLGWYPEFEGHHILGLHNGEASISLEPGGQLEFNVKPQAALGDIEAIYLRFLNEVVSILSRWGHILVALGYQPVSSIETIPLLPKTRYRYMYRYLKDKGRYAHHMMKGTASTQVCIDYSDEVDYANKYRVIAFLSPIIACALDNTPFFEGKVCQENAMRSIIWRKCDADRCGLPKGIFSCEYGYRHYGEFVLNSPPILVKNGEQLIFTGSRLLKDVLDPDRVTEDEVAHVLSMYFPDVRTRRYIEIRIGDALPYPFNLAYAALWKGLMYSAENLEELHDEAVSYSDETYFQLRAQVMADGTAASINGVRLLDRFAGLVEKAEKGLEHSEKKYLNPLLQLVETRLTPKELTLNRLHLGRKEALAWCTLNQIL